MDFLTDGDHQIREWASPSVHRRVNSNSPIQQGGKAWKESVARQNSLDTLQDKMGNAKFIRLIFDD